MKPYPKTKPSGVQWLGQVPEHWEVKAIKWETPVFRGASPRPIDDPVYFDDEGEFAWVRIADVTAAGDHLESTTQQLSRLGSSLSVKLCPGALFLSIAGTVGKPCITKIKCCIHDGFVYFPGFGGETKFLFYVFASGEPYRGLGKLGTQLNLNTDTVGSIIMGFPPPEEQTAIAAYLDRETGRIDELVDKKRDLIERLKEKRTALISRTVTRGVPADIPPETLAKLEAIAGDKLTLNSTLISSKVPWFDKCPSHWKTKRLRHISDVIVVGVVVNPSSYVTDEGVVFLLGGDVREMRIDTSNCKFCSLESSSGPLVKSRLDAGDLVVVRVGYPGVAAVVPPELAGGNIASMMLVRGHPRYCSQWLAYSFNSQIGRDQVEIVQYGAAQKQFNISHAVDFTFPFPTLPEQRAIAAYLDEETAKLDALVAKVETAIERLQEYRTALITAAVTGKIDVREEVMA